MLGARYSSTGRNDARASFLAHERHFEDSVGTDRGPRWYCSANRFVALLIGFKWRVGGGDVVESGALGAPGDAVGSRIDGIVQNPE